jgi:integrase
VRAHLHHRNRALDHPGSRTIRTNVKAVQRLLGHASAAMTLDVYSGLFDNDLDAVADRLDEAAARARADSARTDADVMSLARRAAGV